MPRRPTAGTPGRPGRLSRSWRAVWCPAPRPGSSSGLGQIQGCLGISASFFPISRARSHRDVQTPEGSVQFDPRHPQQFGTSGQADITLMVVGEDQIVWPRSPPSKTMPWYRNSPVRFGDASPHETSWLGGFLSKHIAGQTPGLWTARRSSILAVQRPRLTRLRISRKPSGVMP